MSKEFDAFISQALTRRAFPKKSDSKALTTKNVPSVREQLPAKRHDEPQLEYTGEDTVLEYRVKRAVKKRLNELGAFHRWPVSNGMGQPDLDCHGCYQGQYFAVETKATGKKPTLRQAATIKEIEDAGGIVYVIDSERAAKELFIEISTTILDIG